MFPTAHSVIYRNEMGEVLGWDNPGVYDNPDEWLDLDNDPYYDEEDETDDSDYTYEDYLSDVPDGTREGYYSYLNPPKWNGSPNRPQF